MQNGNRNGLMAMFAAMMAGIGISGRADTGAYSYRPTRHPRTRAASKHNPAGTKLARMADERRLGVRC